MKSKLLKMLVPLMVLAMSSCSKNSDDEAEATENPLITKYDYSAEETQLVHMINNYRVSHGMNSLIIINHISYKSLEHNNYMISNKMISHDLFAQRAQNLMDVLGAYKVGENVAYNFTSNTSVFNAWLNSPKHKANLDGDYTNFGLSITECPMSGKKYYTNMFIKK
jgi:uncharacterized protein YkwD